MEQYQVTFQDGETRKVKAKGSKKAIDRAQNQRRLNGKSIWAKDVKQIHNDN